MSGECQVNVKYQSELDIGGHETCLSLFGSTPRGTIPLLWECSRKSGPVPCFFNMGVLPEALYHFCGSTPAKVV